nr:ATPase, T2SS/T4P/T4SS family [Microbacterium sp. J1-1]
MTKNRRIVLNVIEQFHQTGEITLRRLVKEALRMRPDRLVLGEVRDAEALDLVLALNTGVPGACTVHANSATEALEKLSMLPLLAGRNIDRGFIAPAIATSIDLVVHCVRDRSGRRFVQEIVAPTGEIVEGRIRTARVYLDGSTTQGHADTDSRPVHRIGVNS